MKNKILSLIILTTIIIFSNCSNDDEQSKFVGQLYAHKYFETYQDCLDAQPDPNFFINCSQNLNFIDNTQVEIIITDIKYTVNYEIKNNEIILFPGERTYEIGDGLTFEIIDDKTLKSIDYNSIWELVEVDSIWD